MNDIQELIAIGDQPLTIEERNDLLRVQRHGRTIENKNANLLMRLQDRASKILDRLDQEGTEVRGDVLKDLLSIADAASKFSKSVREDENIRSKLTHKADRKRKGNAFEDVGLNEARALLVSLSKRMTNEEITAMLPVTVEQ
jgi:hypothetical protein